MSVVIKNSYFFVKPGELAFRAASNWTNYLELGVENVTPYYLEGRVATVEFLMRAVLLDGHGKFLCRIENNFPVGGGATKQMTQTGYRISSSDGERVLELERDGGVCIIRGTIYGADGEIVAKDVGDDFLIYKGPAVLGKSGLSRGLVLG